MTRVSVVGLGKLGACMAACFASKGFDVVGIDVNTRNVDLVNRGKAPVFEPGLAELIGNAGHLLRATTDYEQAIQETDATFIVVPTPSDPDGSFSLKYVYEASREIGRALAGKPGYHLVVLTSTVLPGATENTVLPVLETRSGRRCGEGFGLCYSPEFIALGDVIKGFMNPDFLLIGEADPRAGNLLAELYSRVCDNAPPAARMSLVNAELAKISVNSFVTMKITFANMLAALCEAIPGGDVDAVTGALGLDRRIGARYLKGGLGYGGPCFPRDNQALASFARQVGQAAMIPETTDAYNDTIVDRVLARVLACVPSGGKVAVLGMAYKPSTNVVERAQGLQLAQELGAVGFRVTVFDPYAAENARSVLDDRVSYAPSLLEATREVDAVVIATPDPQFRALPQALAAADAHPIVIDGWRMLREQLESALGLDYHALGLGPNPCGPARVTQPLGMIPARS